MYQLKNFEIGGFYHITALPGSVPVEALFQVLNKNEVGLRLILLAAINYPMDNDPFSLPTNLIDLNTLKTKVTDVKKIEPKDFPLYIGWDVVNPMLHELIKGEGNGVRGVRGVRGVCQPSNHFERREFIFERLRNGQI